MELQEIPNEGETHEEGEGASEPMLEVKTEGTHILFIQITLKSPKKPNKEYIEMKNDACTAL